MVLAAALVVAGAVVALLVGGNVAMCLGPLGVTAVQCAKVTGIVPSAGYGPPVLALTTTIAIFLLAPVSDGRRLPVLLGAILGGASGTVAFLAVRPLTMEGFDSTGAWISVPRPLDLGALATVAILGGLLGSIAVRMATRSLTGRSARS